MKVLVANHALNRSHGTETYVATLAAGLLRLGHEVTCFSENLGPAASQLRVLGAATVSDAREAEPPDVIHASHLDSAQLAMAAWPLVPVVFVVHGRGTAEPLERPPVPAQSIEKWVAISDIVAEFMAWRDEIDPNEISVIPNPIDLDRFRPLVPLRTPPNRVLLLGRSTGPEFRGLVEGGCRLAGMKIRFAGDRFHVSDVRNELQRADVAISIGRGALEAAACGIPVIVMSALGSDGLLTPEVAKRELAHNYSGLAVRTMPSAEELGSQLSQSTAALGAWSREWVEEHHDAVVLIPRLVALYEEAVAAAASKLATMGAASLLELRYRELYPALRWWHRLPRAASWQLGSRPLDWTIPQLDEDIEAEISPLRELHQSHMVAAEQEILHWRERYERMAAVPPIAAGIWLHRRLSRRRHSPPDGV